MGAADVWKIVLGAAVALAGTLLAQWSSLAYQTRRQREARRADFQRSSLVQVRDLLLELSEALRNALDVRYADPGWAGLPTYHPVARVISSIGERLDLLAAALEDERLAMKVRELNRFAWLAAIAESEVLAAKDKKMVAKLQHEVARLLGDQLRKLP